MVFKKGHIPTEEMRKKISLTNKGNKPWNFNLKGYSTIRKGTGKKGERLKNNILIKCACGCGQELWKYRICDGHERRYIHGHNTFINNPNKMYLEQTRKKLSLSLKGNQIWLGKHHTEESKQKQRLAKLGRPSPMKGKINRYNKETLIKMSLSKIEAYKDPNSIFNSKEYREKQIKASLQGLLKRPTSFEQRISELCFKFNLPFIYTGNGSFLINFKNPDFVNEKDKIVIEVYYSWFKLRDYGTIETYQEYCRKKYEPAGWKCVFIDETEVLADNWEEVCLNKINNFLMEVKR